MDVFWGLELASYVIFVLNQNFRYANMEFPHNLNPKILKQIVLQLIIIILVT